MTGYVIQTEGLCLQHKGKRALDNMTLALDAGSIHAVVGANGAGKSSLFRVLLGFETADAGTARILGCDSAPGACTHRLRQRRTQPARLDAHRRSHGHAAPPVSLVGSRAL